MMKRILFVVISALVVFFVSCSKKQTSVGDNTKEVESAEFFGMSLHGKDVTSIVKRMEENVGVLSLDGNVDEERQYCKVLFCGVPCGMNMRWEEQNDEVYITSLNFFTSQTSDKAIEALANGISTYYGESQQTEQDEMDNYFRWDGVLMRPVHSEEGGMAVIFY